MKAKRLLAMSAALCLGSAAAAQDGAEGLGIAPQPLDKALEEFADKSGLQVIYVADLADGKNTPGAKANLSDTETLDQLLSNTGLEYEFLNANTVTVQAVADSEGSSDSGNSPSMPRPIMIGQASEGMSKGTKREQNGEADAAGAKEWEQSFEEITVTGTRIKGVKDQFSPVTQIGREEMDLAGYANVSDLFDNLPQNFGGGVTNDTILAGDFSGSGSSSVNLRGLGNEATLVLLNGRRLAAGGLEGDFVDISAIPISAIDRVEVLSDGASAIYGSDAIAGVVNIILRNDFDGAETRLNLSTLTDGGRGTIKVGQTVGFSQEKVRGLLTYEYSSEDELDANEKEFSESAVDPYYLLPFNEKHNVFASAGAELSDRVRVTADGYYNDRNTKSFFSDNVGSFLGNFQEVNIQQYGAAAGLVVELPKDWQGDLNFSHSKSNQVSEAKRLPPSTTELNVDATGEIISVDATIGGPLFRLTDEPVRVVVGGHYRSESVDQFYVIQPGDNVNTDHQRSRDVFAGFGEIYAPLVSEANAIPGVARLAVTVAARYEDYSDVGSSFDPKVGAVWTPFEGVNLRGTYGTSFRAPTLNRVREQIPFVILAPYANPSLPGGVATSLSVFGFTTDLDPEQADTWTVGVDVSPSRIEGLQLRGTYFSIDYADRVGFPTSDFNTNFQFENFTGIVILNPGQQLVQSFVDQAGSFFDYSALFPIPPLSLADVTAILDTRMTNLLASKVEGIDLELTYSTSSAVGDWSFFFNSTMLTDFTEQVAPTTPIIDKLDTFGNPVDLRFRAGASLATGPVNAALSANYVGGYTDDQALGAATPVDSWTTIDASIRFDLGKSLGDGIAQGASVLFSVTNLLNEDPPTIGPRAPGTGTRYDAANANPLGRRVGLLLTKRF